MIKLQPQYLTLAKLLAGRIFHIPEYQRAYSWTTKQRTDLFEDIKRAYTRGPEGGHFMAAVVALRRKALELGAQEYHIVEVVDGQQRLTTIIILLNAIKLRLDPQNKDEARLSRDLSELLVKAEADELLLLQTNHDSSQHFASYLRAGDHPSPGLAKTTADRELLRAIEECHTFLDSWVEKVGPFSALVSFLNNRLFFLFHEIEDEQSVYTVFEVLNSRGLDVSWLDRLKAILMGAAFELKSANRPVLIKDLHTLWREIYSVIGLRMGMNTEALRFAATLRLQDAPARPLGEQDAVAELRSNIADAGSIRDTADWLLQVTKACETILSDVRLGAVTRISQARMLAIAIHLRKDLSESQRDRLLSHWEKVTFRIYGMLRNDARTRVGDYVKLAWQIINETLTPQEIHKRIEKIGETFPITDAIDGLRNRNCYDGWEIELRYFMYRYEEYLTSKQGQNFKSKKWERIWNTSASETIEHVWPRVKAPEKHRHRLGNLILLPPKLNSRLQDNVAKTKIEDYRKTGLLIVEEVADIIETEGWNARAIEKRESTLLKWAAIEWGD